MSMKIAKGMFSTFPHLMCKGLPSYEQLTFIWLFHHANAEGVCFPSINTLAEECGMSRDSIKRSLKSLENKGYIGKEIRKRNDGGNTSNLYTVYFLDCANSAEGIANTPNPLSANTAEGVANTATNYNHLTKIKKPELKSNIRNDYSETFEQFWELYPKRAGSQGKDTAWKAWQARLKEGAKTEEITAGAARYLIFCGATDIIGTQFVMMASTFLNKDKEWLNPWEVPIKQQKHQPSQLEREADAMLDMFRGAI